MQKNGDKILLNDDLNKYKFIVLITGNATSSYYGTLNATLARVNNSVIYAGKVYSSGENYLQIHSTTFAMTDGRNGEIASSFYYTFSSGAYTQTYVKNIYGIN